MFSDDGSKHYEVMLRIVLTVIDRHLEFAAYWPADDKDAAPVQGSQKRFGMTTAFRPGTA